jgi:sucrose-phosphate synthase
MARNEWINGYLEAILDVGSNVTRKRQDGKQSVIPKFEEKEKEKEKEEKLFSPTKYFVQEVVNSFDESELHRTWIKVRT